MPSLRSQLNVSMDETLVSEVKIKARKNGLTISEYISRLVRKDNSLSLENKDQDVYSINARITMLEERIDNVRTSCPGQKGKIDLKPFTQEEANNCTAFMRSIFKKIIIEKNLKTQSNAWTDFLPHFEKLDAWNASLTFRLKEILLFEEPEPWTSIELNNLTKNKKYPCPIREALISWSNLNNIPDQQTICEKGEELVSNFYN